MKIINEKEDCFTQWFKTILWNDHTPSCSAASYKSRILVTYAEYFAIGKFWKRQAMYIEGNIKSRSRHNFYRPKDISNESLCVFVALIIRHAKHNCWIVLSSLNYQNLPYFFKLHCIFFHPFHKRQEIVKRVIEH